MAVEKVDEKYKCHVCGNEVIVTKVGGGELIRCSQPMKKHKYRKEAIIMGEHNCYRIDLQECIKRKAYELWEKDGCRQGHDLYYWLIAEKTVKVQVKK